MHKTFTDKMKHIDWKVTLIKFLKSQLGSNGVPLNYFVRDNVNPTVRNNPNFLDDYADRTPLQGRVLNHDASKVHSYIIILISENTVSEQKVLLYNDNTNYRENFLALKDLYEGVGANDKAVLAAESDIQEMFYAGENNPHMLWDEFEIRLTNAFEIVDKDAGRQVHTDKLKLRLLNKNIRADLLTTTKTTIDIQTIITPMTINYSSAFTN